MKTTIIRDGGVSMDSYGVTFHRAARTFKQHRRTLHCLRLFNPEAHRLRLNKWMNDALEVTGDDGMWSKLTEDGLKYADPTHPTPKSLKNILALGKKP